MCKYDTALYLWGMLDARRIIELGFEYGEEFDRSQVDKWLKGQNSSKAVRVMLAMMSAMSAGKAEKEDTLDAVRFTEEKRVVQEDMEAMKDDFHDEVIMANYRYDAPGAMDGWKWEGRKVQVCFRECVYSTKEYVEIGGCVSLEGDLVRLGHDGKFKLL